MSGNLQQDMQYLNGVLAADASFDVVYRVIHIGGKEGCIYFLDGFCKDDIIQKLLQYLMDMKPDNLPKDAHEMAKQGIPYVEVDMEDMWDKIITTFLSGTFVLLVDGYEKALLIDARTYPSRSVAEPEKDKTLRGSKDGFVETVVFNTALIRRRIRSSDLRMVMTNAGDSSKTDIVLCYMESRVDHKFLQEIQDKIKKIQVDALSMNQESLAECLYNRKWFNP
ncbi:MAG: spore germination protein, partial [Lachnospiraceae bacterium]|nr:spore germination protein [Lachnospiraceae bacterium]